MTQEGARYLLDWSRGLLARCPRPQHYSILGHRYSADLREPHHPGHWTTPRRVKHVDVTLDQDAIDGGVSSGASSEDEDLGLPVGFDE